MRYLVAACFLLTSLAVAVAQDSPAPAPASSAQVPAPGITVEGVGTAKLPADTLEFRGIIAIGGATLADAMLEHDRATTRLSKGLEQLGTKGLTYELRGALLSSMSENQFKQRQQQAMQYGQQAPPHKCVVKDYVTLRAPLDGLSTKEVSSLVVSILEMAAELDLKDPSDNTLRYDMYGRVTPDLVPEGWTPGLSFLLRDPRPLYAAALKEALKDAQGKAEVQAGLVRSGLGRICGVETLSGGSVVPGRVRELQHRVVLRVRHELARSN